MKELNHYKIGKVLGISMAAIGTASLLGGFFSLPPQGTDKSISELPQSKFIIGGAVILAGSWIPYVGTKIKNIMPLVYLMRNNPDHPHMIDLDIRRGRVVVEGYVSRWVEIAGQEAAY